MDVQTHDHPAVLHPNQKVVKRSAIGRFNDSLTRTLARSLGSMVLVYACLVVPLVAINMPEAVRLIITILFSTWFQGWSLPVIQRTQNTISERQQQKAEADHRALTHLANVVDEIADHLGVAESQDPLPPITNPNYRPESWPTIDNRRVNI
jgi:hypothetical protein